jgi:hypothetical protein
MNTQYGNLVPTLLGCTVWFPVIVWVYMLLGGAISGDVDPIVAFVGITLCFVAAGWLMVHPTHPYAIWLIIGIYSVLITMPAMRRFHHKRQLDQLEIEQIENAYDTLSLRPGATHPRFRIAAAIFRKGAPEHAIGLGEFAIEGMAKHLVGEEIRQIRSWQALTRPRAGITIPCAQCGFQNPPGDCYCDRCRAPYLLYYAKGHVMSPATTKRLTAIWLASMTGILGIPMAAASLTAPISGAVVIGILAVAGGVVAIVFVRTREEA